MYILHLNCKFTHNSEIPNNLMKIDWEKILQAVVEVESTTKGESSKFKRARAVAIGISNAVIDIPFVPERIEAWMLGYLIDCMVWCWNRVFGTDWGEPIRQQINN